MLFFGVDVLLCLVSLVVHALGLVEVVLWRRR